MPKESGLTPLNIALKAKEAFVEQRREMVGELVLHRPTMLAREQLIEVDRAIETIDRATAEETKIHHKSALAEVRKNPPKRDRLANKLP